MASDSPAPPAGRDAAALRAFAPRPADKRQNGIYRKNDTQLQKVTPLIGEANNFRVIFFVLTFFSIGMLSDFRKLWQEGSGKLALVYFVSLFGFVIWVGLLISWLFFHGMKPPLAS